MEKDNSIVFLENIEKKFSGVYALKGVTFSVKQGEVRCLVGENGCGKSTLIKIISGFHKPDSGKVYLNGYEYIDLMPIESIKNGIQVIYQDFSLFPNLTVSENISYSYMVSKQNRFFNIKESKEIAKNGLQKINVDIDLSAVLGNLSVADKQLVAIARSLVSENTKLLILDEPTTALTHNEIERLLEVIKILKSNGVSIIFVSHKLRELTTVSDTITILRNGEVVANGLISEFDESKIAYYMTGREIKGEKYFVENIDNSKTILEVKSMYLKDKYTDISFSVKEGEILGITGLLGSGRSEIGQSLYGMLPYDKGTIIFNGEEIKIKNILDARKYAISYVPEDRLTEGLFLKQSILNNIIVSIYKQLSNIFGVINFKNANKLSLNTTKDLKLNTTDLDMYVQNLSGGNQQKVVIAKWLVSNTKLIILNGPTVGVDVGAKFEIHLKLKEIAKKGIGVIVISDDISELIENCNRILIISKGKLVKEVESKNETVDGLLNLILQDY